MKINLLERFIKQDMKREVFYQWCCPCCNHALSKMPGGQKTTSFLCPCCSVHGCKTVMVLARFVDKITSLSVVLKTDEQQWWWEKDILGRIELK